MHIRDEILKLSVMDGIKDDYVNSLIEEHMSFCRECTLRAAEFADQHVENKLNMEDVDASASLTKEEISGLLKWRESPKVLNDLKEKDKFEDFLRKHTKTDLSEIKLK